ncbi:MAG: response regulator [Deltaproteobacteria bacterium]|nr:response regulator [Nannocystaceae bacterium]
MEHHEPRVLLVEDNPAEARLLRELVDDAAVRPIVFDHVTRLSDACARLERGGIAAVVLDLALPDSEGLQTIAALDASHRGIPVIVVTGHADDELRAAAAALGVIDVVVKDELDPLRLARILERVLVGSRAPLLAPSTAGSTVLASREIAGRTHRVRAAIEFGVDCMRKLEHTDGWVPEPSSPRVGVQRRRTATRQELQHDTVAHVLRALEAAQLELDRMSELMIEVHRALLRSDPGAADESS